VHVLNLFIATNKYIFVVQLITFFSKHSKLHSIFHLILMRNLISHKRILLMLTSISSVEFILICKPVCIHV
jgi:hypothetical protein